MRRSRPSSSVPNGCARDGRREEAVEVERRRRVRRDERGADRRRTRAPRPRRATTAADGRRSRRRRTESPRGRADASSVGAAAAQVTAFVAQARVDDAEDDVDDQARDDENGGGEEDERLQHLVVALKTESTISVPRPGRANTYSTMTVPPTRWATMIPAAVIAGSDAFGSMCRTTTWRRRSPFPAAVRMYGRGADVHERRPENPHHRRRDADRERDRRQQRRLHAPDGSARIET